MDLEVKYPTAIAKITAPKPISIWKYCHRFIWTSTAITVSTTGIMKKLKKTSMGIPSHWGLLSELSFNLADPT